MGTRGLEIVRFRGRYYIRFHRFDSYIEGLGAQIVASIPTGPGEYQKWLKSMRERYAATERALEQHVYEIRDESEPDYSLFSEFVKLPSELPRLDDYDAEFFYTINLDNEVLTMNHSIHWKLGNIPRQDDLWLRAIRDSIYPYKPTISPDLCPEEHMASLALELPDPNWEIGCAFRTVTPRTNIGEAWMAFLTCVLAEVLVQYTNEIIWFGREWSSGSFPFRELAFALVSIASGQGRFHHSHLLGKSTARLPESPGWFDEEWAGEKAPLLEFGSMSHRPGEPPGASPTETMYWLEDVLVSLTLVVDGEAIAKAVTWGIEGKRANFQIIVLSLFKVAFAEVSLGDDGEPFLNVSRPVRLSPLRAKYCVSTHPRERPVWNDKTKRTRHLSGDDLMHTLQTNGTGTVRRLRDRFPGLAALVNFFEVAATRRAASSSPGRLPSELYCRILDFVDYDTWKTCLVVSPELRSHCLYKYRLDDRMSIVAGPFVRLGVGDKKRLLSFDFANIQTGKVIPASRTKNFFFSPGMRDCNLMPVIGSDRKALMVNVDVQFVPAWDMPVEADSDDDVA